MAEAAAEADQGRYNMMNNLEPTALAVVEAQQVRRMAEMAAVVLMELVTEYRVELQMALVLAVVVVEEPLHIG
jgi:hypothetical protein